MLEKLLGSLPDWMKQKLALRMGYTAGSFITARLIAFLSGDPLKNALGVAVGWLGHIGIVMQIQIVSIDDKTLQAFITGVLMIAGEWVISHVHENHVKPIVTEQLAEKGKQPAPSIPPAMQGNMPGPSA